MCVGVWLEGDVSQGDGGLQGRRRDDSFKTALSTAALDGNLAQIFGAVLILFLIHVVWLCQMPGEVGVWQPHPSLLPSIWVCVKCGFGADVEGLHNGRPALGSPGLLSA